MVDRIAFDHGVLLRGTPLWFDATTKRDLCVVTSLALGLPPKHRRLVANSALAELLNQAGYSGAVLPAPCDRWVGVSGQELQFLEAPAEAGAAYALVASGGERLLVTGLLRKDPLKWPEVDLVVAQVPALAHRGGPLSRAVQGVALFADTAVREGSGAAVLCDSVEVALELQRALPDLLRPVGLLAKLCGHKVPRRQPALAVWDARLSPQTRVAFVDSGLLPYEAVRGAGPAAEASFRVTYYADWAALKQLVSVSGTPKLVLIGPRLSLQDEAQVELGGDLQLRCLAPTQQLSLAPKPSSN